MTTDQSETKRAYARRSAKTTHVEPLPRGEPSAEPDYHFVLRFMDEEIVLHELYLDHFQIILRQAEPGGRLSISLKINQFDEIRDLPILSDRLLP